MTIDAALTALIEAAAEAGARRALEALPPERRGGLVPIREAPVAYRAILEAEHAGELRVYRRGKASFVDRDQLEEWIRRAPSGTAEPEPDEVAELIELHHRRRRRRA